MPKNTPERDVQIARTLAIQIAGPNLHQAKRISDFLLNGTVTGAEEPQEKDSSATESEDSIWNRAIDAVLSFADDNAQWVADNLSFEARDTAINRIGDLKR